MKIVKSQLSVSSLRFLENYSITISAFTISVTTLPALCTLSEYLMYNIMERDGWKSDATLKKILWENGRLSKEIYRQHFP